MNSKYFGYEIKIFMLGFIILTVINTALSKVGYDLINMFSNFIKRNSNLSNDFEKIIYLLAGIFAIIFALNRDNWLPFLGECVLPSALIPIKNINGDTIVKINVKPNTKIAYWSAKPKKNNSKDPDVEEAYDNYSNSGVVMSDKNGIAILTLNKGTGYYVPSGQHISSHLHYRELNDTMGLIGPVKTHYFN